MSQEPWNEWSSAWRQPDPTSSLQLDKIERRVRRRLTWRTAQMVADLASCALGLVISLWCMTLDRPLAAAVGGAGLAFSLLSLFVALGGRHSSKAADRSVIAALDWEIAEVRADARRSVGGLVIAGAGTGFLIFCQALFSVEGLLTGGRERLLLAGFAIMALSIAWSGWLLLRRRARLHRLTALRDELAGDAE
ncbi:hypothetical protein OVA11_13200 [Caulobacter sp. SL161]|uniref:hypothetical protein n=1 Tax=Caulobacter sp. SL161 TaxID=2995156 RepID=UPI002272F5F5|nr:hypothetical protein [Caulobacter sp. SL161]MCY1647982.1 hypothetical protein [Caulobacter sp. SL161]